MYKDLKERPLLNYKTQKTYARIVVCLQSWVLFEQQNIVRALQMWVLALNSANKTFQPIINTVSMPYKILEI